MGSSLPCDVSFLIKLRRVVNFQFVHLFSCCVDGRDDFQAPHMFGNPEKSLIWNFTYQELIKNIKEAGFRILEGEVLRMTEKKEVFAFKGGYFARSSLKDLDAVVSPQTQRTLEDSAFGR